MKTILFPTDITVNHAIALNYLRLLARTWQARVVLLHVYQPMVGANTLPTFNDPAFAGAGQTLVGLDPAASQELEAISRQHLTQLATDLQAEGLDVVADWRMGTVEDEVIEAARQHQPDLLITHRSPGVGFFDRLVGSNADDIARAAPCPVLYMPAVAETHTQARIRSVVYVLQQNITQQIVTDQTAPIIDAFDAHLTVIPPDDIDDYKPDLYILQRREPGFLGGVFSSDPTEKLLSDSHVPVLVYHGVN